MEVILADKHNYQLIMHKTTRNYTESKLNFESASATWLSSGER